jgi:hypothetical protein
MSKLSRRRARRHKPKKTRSNYCPSQAQTAIAREGE